MVMTTLYARQQKRHRCIEQSFGLCGRGKGWDDLGTWDSPGKNTGVGCHALPQGIFPTQGSNHVSGIAGGFFIHTWKLHRTQMLLKLLIIRP